MSAILYRRDPSTSRASNYHSISSFRRLSGSRLVQKLQPMYLITILLNPHMALLRIFSLSVCHTV